MKNLHVWLLISLFAVAACKPAVRERSTSSGLPIAKVLQRLKKLPKVSAEVPLKGIDDIGAFVTRSNRVTRSQFDKAFPKADWKGSLGLPYHSKARSALLDFLSVKPEAIDAVKSGRMVDEVLNDYSLRVMNVEDLMKRMKDIYAPYLSSSLKDAPLNEVNLVIESRVERIIRILEGLERFEPDQLRKKLRKIADGLDEAS